VEHELNVAVKAAQAAAAAILAIYQRPEVASTEKSDGKGPLTEADLASNDLLIAHLREAFPDDAILSEETVDDPARVANRRCWVIDPLDGTKEFTEKVPQFVVSVGLAVGGKPAVGVLLNPATGELFTGIVGVGATYNGAPCRVTTRSTLEGARLLVSATETKKGWFDHLKGVCETEPMGSVAYKLGLVAAGLADATFTPKPRNEWDLLGGVACVLAAGGRCSDGSGEDYGFNRPDPLHVGVNGNNGALHPIVLELMRGRA
jgi:myo-inositol-1(or 4)-monophosphatase